MFRSYVFSTLLVLAVATAVPLIHVVPSGVEQRKRCFREVRGGVRGGAVAGDSTHEAKDKNLAEAHAQGVCPCRRDGGFIVTQTTRDCGAAVRYWPAGRGETEAEGETYFGFSAVEPSGTTSGTTHAQGTRDCGVSTISR